MKKATNTTTTTAEHKKRALCRGAHTANIAIIIIVIIICDWVCCREHTTKWITFSSKKNATFFYGWFNSWKRVHTHTENVPQIFPFFFSFSNIPNAIFFSLHSVMTMRYWFWKILYFLLEPNIRYERSADPYNISSMHTQKLPLDRIKKMC